ncbi:MAG: type II toxin-antitoxin system HigB family toxin [Candidatus Hodarchaeales archaeon]
MDLLRKERLFRCKRKNLGNRRLVKAIDVLIDQIEAAIWDNKKDLLESRPDADCVHSSGFYIFDLSDHRTIIMVLFEKSVAIVVWVGSHDDYVQTFRNNKRTVEKWLRKQQLI